MNGAWCQRWRARRDSWRHRSEGGFDADRYTVAPLVEDDARAFVTTHHYSGTWPAARLRYGLHDLAGQLLGVAVLGVPMTRAVLTGPLPHLEPYTESLELSRLVLLDAVPANAESWFLARVYRDAAEAGLRGVVAFSDPEPRQVNGHTVMPGHVGTIYQALGATYTGKGTARTLTLLPDGSVLTARARAKVTAAERGHQGVIDRLVRLGATAPAPGGDRAAWLTGALGEVGATARRHGGNHRYVFRVGRSRAERTRTTIGLSSRPYPKRDLGQLDLFGVAGDRGAC